MKILVTGGASGLGGAITEKLAKNTSDQIYFTYNLSVSKAEALEAKFENVKALKCDFVNEEELSQFEKKIPEMDLDALVNNAITGFTVNHFHKIEHSVFYESFNHNVLPVIRITQQTLKTFIKKRFGKIVNIISSAAFGRPPTGWSEYVANKAYIAALSRSCAIEYAKYNITSNCVSPSFMETNLTGDMDERIVESLKNKHPLKSLVTPEEVAESVAFLVHATQQINGNNLVINAADEIF